MKCYTHRQSEAVAICKWCGRALCSDCVVEVELLCACKSRCESKVAMANNLLQKNQQVFQRAGAAYFRSTIFYFLIGSFFLLNGSFNASGNQRLDTFIMGLGAIFLSYGIVQLSSARKYKKKNKF
ncbi:MAG: hypothetical protein R3F23_06320 [Verrucomicrobiia bacterium]